MLYAMMHYIRALDQMTIPGFNSLRPLHGKSAIISELPCIFGPLQTKRVQFLKTYFPHGKSAILSELPRVVGPLQSKRVIELQWYYMYALRFSLQLNLYW